MATEMPISAALFDDVTMLPSQRLTIKPYDLLQGIRLCHSNPALRSSKTHAPWQDTTEYVEYIPEKATIPGVIPFWLWIDKKCEVIWIIHFTDVNGNQLVLPTRPESTAPLLHAVYLQGNFMPTSHSLSELAVERFTDVLYGWRRSYMRRNDGDTNRPPGPSMMKTLRDALDGYFLQQAIDEKGE